MIRVLIVDDDPEVADILDEMVTRFGHQTAVAHNGVQAIRAFREFAPHVVLLDIRMPGLDGHTVLDHLRGSSQPPTVIIVSGNHQEDEAREVLQSGAFDYVTKPRFQLSAAGDRSRRPRIFLGRRGPCSSAREPYSRAPARPRNLSAGKRLPASRPAASVGKCRTASGEGSRPAMTRQAPATTWVTTVSRGVRLRFSSLPWTVRQWWMDTSPGAISSMTRRESSCAACSAVRSRRASRSESLSACTP